MKILIIDNNSRHINELNDLCLELSHEVKIIKWGQFKLSDANNFDLVVLSGGTGMPISEHKNNLAEELEFIRSSDKPMIGICLGFELIVDAFGCAMKKEEEQKGLVDVSVLKDDPIFMGKQKFEAFVAHKWYVKEVVSDVIPLAVSEKGIQVIKHSTRSIYGFQFHPEVIVDRNFGTEIFKKCVELLTK